MIHKLRLQNAPAFLRDFLAAILSSLAIFGMLTAPVQAMRVTPMVVEITTQGAGSSARIEVENVNAAPLAYETRIFKIDYDENNQLVETPADEDFLVFPPQGTIPQGERQVIRVQWVGEPDIDVSRAYFVSIRQLPVEFEQGPEDEVNASVQVVYHMKTLLAVAPEGAKPDVEVVSVTPAPVPVEPEGPSLGEGLAPEGEAAAPELETVPGLEITLRNNGNRYAMMSGATWVIGGYTVDGEPVMMRLEGETINQVVGVGYLAPAGGERTFALPMNVEFDPNRKFRVEFTRR